MCFKKRNSLNSGVRVKKPSKTDYIAGVASGITYEEINSGGNWEQWLPSKERQSKTFDTMACVTFSALNSLESQLNLLINYGLSADKIRFLNDNGYLDEFGKVNFSDRFTAKMSGTTTRGNYLTNVWDSIRHDGILPEKDWKFEEPFNWGEYYKEIPQELKDKAKKFLEVFEIQYEWVTGNISYHIKQAPIQIVSKVCSPWNVETIIPACGIGSDHATLLYNMDTDHMDIYDHYDPFNKKLSLDFPIPYMMKGIIKERVPLEGWVAIKYVSGVAYGEGSMIKVLTDLSVRQEPGLKGLRLDVIKKGNQLQVISNEVKVADGYMWQKIKVA